MSRFSVNAVALELRRADVMASSGMCKAGFAGDDAPRAVFREHPTLSPQLPRTLLAMFAQLLSLA